MPSGNRDLPFNGGDYDSVGPGKSRLSRACGDAQLFKNDPFQLLAE
jgi:hypothetical protein